MKIKISKKVIGGNHCYDVVSKGSVIKTFVSKVHAEAYITEKKIEKYTMSKSYNEDMMFVNYYAGGVV